jgi:hypothetical protein
MNKYVVACCLHSDHDLDQQIIKAKTEFDAVVDYLGTKPPGIRTLDELLEWAEDQDMLINLIELN